MNMTRLVAEFHAANDLPIGSNPRMLNSDEWLHRLELLNEEYDELVQSIADGDFVESVDAIGDMIYVLYGTFVSMGIDGSKVMKTIHESNMTKIGGEITAKGKLTKPPWYKAPDIEGALNSGTIDFESIRSKKSSFSKK